MMSRWPIWKRGAIKCGSDREEVVGVLALNGQWVYVEEGELAAESKETEPKTPSKSLKGAAKRESLCPHGGASAGGGGKGKGKAGHQNGSASGSASVHPKIAQRASWLYDDMYIDRPISQKTLVALSALDLNAAMVIFNEVQNMRAEVRDPNKLLLSMARKSAPTRSL